MPEPLLFVLILIIAYMLGSIPFGLIIVRLRTGQDVRKMESGRTGGTNVGRVAGVWAGLATAFLDGLKGAVTVWLARWLLPDNHLLAALAPVAAVIGHNYSIFLSERTPEGRWRLRGGAGGATTVGGAAGLWLPSLLFIVPVALLVFFVIGYASLTTLSVALTSIILFAVRAYLGYMPWEYVLFGVLTEVILLIALRPNIQRLINGTERVVGLRARRAKNLPVNSEH